MSKWTAAKGAMLRRRRLALGLTQHLVAKRAVISQKTYSRIERAEVDDPGFIDMARIAHVLQLPLERLAARFPSQDEPIPSGTPAGPNRREG